MPLSVPHGGGTAAAEAWALPSTLPGGARTFLPGAPAKRTTAAVTRPIPALQPHSSTTILEGQADGRWCLSASFSKFLAISATLTSNPPPSHASAGIRPAHFTAFPLVGGRESEILFRNGALSWLDHPFFPNPSKKSRMTHVSLPLGYAEVPLHIPAHWAALG